MGCLICRSLLRAEVCYEYFNSVMLVTYPRTAFDVRLSHSRQLLAQLNLCSVV